MEACSWNALFMHRVQILPEELSTYKFFVMVRQCWKLVKGFPWQQLRMSCLPKWGRMKLWLWEVKQGVERRPRYMFTDSFNGFATKITKLSLLQAKHMSFLPDNVLVSGPGATIYTWRNDSCWTRRVLQHCLHSASSNCCKFAELAPSHLICPRIWLM